MNDIDCGPDTANSSGALWNGVAGFQPIAEDSSPGFTGTLDGRNQTISNLTINSLGVTNVGLFGELKGTVKNIKFADIEALVMGLGGDVREGDGSRVALLLNGGVKHAHRPHPGKEAKQYQVREIKEWLIALGVKA